MLLDLLAVDKRAVGAAQILQERVIQNTDNDGMLAAHRQIVDLDVVMRLATDGSTFLCKGVLLQYQAVHAENQLRHSIFPTLTEVHFNQPKTFVRMPLGAA